MKSESIALPTIEIVGKVKKKLSPLPKGLVVEKMLTRSEKKDSYVEEKFLLNTHLLIKGTCGYCLRDFVTMLAKFL